MAEQVIKQIRGQYLHIAESHRRSVWGDMAELTESIAARGILVPLIVRDRKAGGYEIGAGARRFKAGDKAGLKTLPCIVRDLDDEAMILLQRDENVGRTPLHPIDEAMLCKDLTDLGHDTAAVAKRLIMKRPEVERRLRLLALSPKARKAYIEGALDNGAALALATTDHAKQADVLAAHAAGSLQLEEIPGYVRRTFTASLADAPWRLSDEKLLPVAGACTACPKRSDVQRALFGDEGRGVRCLDVDCWRAKMDATWKRELARPEATVHDQAADQLFLPAGDGRPVVVRSSGMVDADAPCPALIGRTWREAVFGAVPDGAEGPTIYIARDQDGRPRFLLREAVATKLVRKSDAVKEARETARQADPVRPDAAPSPRNEGKVRRALVQRMAAAVAAGEHDTWSWIVERVIDGATARAVAAAGEAFDSAIRALDTEGLDDKPGLLELARQSGVYARRIATVVLLIDAADVVGEIGESVRVLAALCEVDLDAAEREIRGKS